MTRYFKYRINGWEEGAWNLCRQDGEKVGVWVNGAWFYTTTEKFLKIIEEQRLLCLDVSEKEAMLRML